MFCNPRTEAAVHLLLLVSVQLSEQQGVRGMFEQGPLLAAVHTDTRKSTGVPKILQIGQQGVYHLLTRSLTGSWSSF